MGTISFDCFEFLLLQAHCAPSVRDPGLSDLMPHVGMKREKMYAKLITWEEMMPVHQQVYVHHYVVYLYQGQKATIGGDPAPEMPSGCHKT